MHNLHLSTQREQSFRRFSGGHQTTIFDNSNCMSAAFLWPPVMVLWTAPRSKCFHVMHLGASFIPDVYVVSGTTGRSTCDSTMSGCATKIPSEASLYLYALALSRRDSCFAVSRW